MSPGAQQSATLVRFEKVMLHRVSRSIRKQFGDSRNRGGKRLVQGPTRVGIQVVADQDQALGLRIVLIQKLLDAPRPFDLATLRRDPHAPPSAQRLEEHEQIALTMALIFIVIPRHASGLHRYPRALIGSQ